MSGTTGAEPMTVAFNPGYLLDGFSLQALLPGRRPLQHEGRSEFEIALFDGLDQMGGLCRQ